MPSTNDAVHAALSDRYSFTKLTASIKMLLDGGAHFVRAAAALSSIEDSRFSRGTEQFRRKRHSVFVTSCLPARSITRSTISEIPGRLQPCSESLSMLDCPAPCLASFGPGEVAETNPHGFEVRRSPQDFQSSAATDFSDENLEAKTPGGGGRVNEERKPLNRSILDAPADPTQSKLVSSRCHCY